MFYCAFVFLLHATSWRYPNGILCVPEMRRRVLHAQNSEKTRVLRREKSTIAAVVTPRFLFSFPSCRKDASPEDQLSKKKGENKGIYCTSGSIRSSIDTEMRRGRPSSRALISVSFEGECILGRIDTRDRRRSRNGFNFVSSAIYACLFALFFIYIKFVTHASIYMILIITKLILREVITGMN